MAKQFQYHPIVEYGGRKVRDFTRCARIFPIIKEDDSICADYYINEGETPTQLAQDLYGKPELYWVLLNLNNIINPWIDWPMEFNDLVKYTQEKYNVVDIYDTGFYGLEEFWFPTNRLGDALLMYPQFSTVEEFQNASIVSQMSYFEYESMLNDLRRPIRVIRPDEIDNVLDDYRDEIRA